MTLRKAAILDGTFAEKYDNRIRAIPLKSGSDVSLAGAWQRYLQCGDRPRFCESTGHQYELQFGKFVRWLQSSNPNVKHIGGVTKFMARGFLSYLETDEKCSSGTYNKYVDLLKTVFHFLKAEAGVNADNPWEEIKHRKKLVNHRKDFTVQEQRMILEKSSGRMRTLFYLGFYTGQRLVDCCTIKWEQFDFENNVVKVIPMKTRNTSGLEVKLSLHPDFRRHIEEIRMNQSGQFSGYVLPDIASWYRRDRAFLVTKIQEFLSSCGIQIHKEGTGHKGTRAVPVYGFHSCRHTFVTLCQNAGTPDRVIASIVGESYRLYSHVDQESRRKAVSTLPSATDVGDNGVPYNQAPATLSETSLSDSDLESLFIRVQAERHRRGIDHLNSKVA
jgi:integrase